jgi:DNA polymerase-3 subunit gamma/tau
MRQFCQELIEHFRNLLVIRSVKKPEEILDLAAAELDELRTQAGNMPPQDIQRRLTLLLKADAEMAHASFPRLIMEMVLLKAALLAPVIPIQELLEKIKQLEAGAVHTPALPWETARTPASSQAVSQHADQVRSPSQLQTPLQPPAAVQTASTSRSAMPGGDIHTVWGRFVAFVIGKNPAIGSVLEHGSPLKQESGVLEIGFPSGSYYLTAAQDADFISGVQALALESSGVETVIRIRPIESNSVDAPMSLAEKKKSDDERRMGELRQEVETHPLVKEAQRVFGGNITEIRAF